MIDANIASQLEKIFRQFPEIIGAYLFGSFLEKKEQARDVDLALLVRPGENHVDLYMDLYPRLAELFAPLEVDIVFLDSASLPVRFEVISTGETIYCSDYQQLTDFECITSRDYMDFRYHLEMARQELYDRLRKGASFV
ncbi:MAG: nucleotidyltransferase domain-containing protein [Firmicutes bacterium]|nr:nucleotidyltransferase domain-containing protein [Bacillota bacterium]